MVSWPLNLRTISLCCLGVLPHAKGYKEKYTRVWGGGLRQVGTRGTRSQSQVSTMYSEAHLNQNSPPLNWNSLQTFLKPNTSWIICAISTQIYSVDQRPLVLILADQMWRWHIFINNYSIASHNYSIASQITLASICSHDARQSVG